MRPVKQAGVISTHTLVTFAPAAASVSSGAVLLLLHVSRLGFFFVSSCMLTYAYRDLSWRGLPRFTGAGSSRSGRPLPAERHPVQHRRDRVLLPGGRGPGAPGPVRFTRAVVRSGSDNAYGVYLAHVLVITTLVRLGWKHLNAVLPWPLLCLLTVGIVAACCVPLTALLARTPLAVPLTGRRRAPWRRPRRQQAARREPGGQGQRGGLRVPQQQFTEAT